MAQPLVDAFIEKMSESSRTTMTHSESGVSMATVGEAMSDALTPQTLATTGLRRSALRVKTQTESLSREELSHTFDADPNRHVKFDHVEVHEHNTILGCNPSVQHGPPLTIAWSASSSYCARVDAFEEERATRKKSPLFLKLSSEERRNMLKEEGFTSEEFTMVETHLDEIRRSREDSKTEKSDLQAIIAASKRKKQQQQKEKKGMFGGRMKLPFGRKQATAAR